MWPTDVWRIFDDSFTTDIHPGGLLLRHAMGQTTTVMHSEVEPEYLGSTTLKPLELNHCPSSKHTTAPP